MSCCSPSKEDSGVTPPVTPSSCPACQNAGQPVDRITPQHTLKRPFREEITDDGHYQFCENPDCDTVYFSDNGQQSFATEQLINRVTCKDPSPETPLCYCYKISKGDALNEYRESQQSTVLATIMQKMAEKACFCDKSNPRGACCTTDIKNWLKGQGIAQSESEPTESGSGCSSSCC